MKNIFKTIALCAAAAASVACTNDKFGNGMGALSLGVDMEAATRAMSAEDLLANARVNIYYADFSGLVRTYKYADAPSVIYLTANDYRVDVVAGEAAEAMPVRASWLQKSYEGSADFSIRSGQNTSVQVEAGVSNAIFKLTFDSTIKANFGAGYSVNVGLSEGNTLQYNSTNSGAESYFLIDGIDEPAFEWSFNGTLGDGTPVSKTGKVADIEKGKIYSLTLRYTVTDGLGTLGLMVDYSTEDIDDIIIFEPVSTGLAPSEDYEIWARHANVHADVDESEYEGATVTFAYSSDGSSWTNVNATRTEEGVYDAVLSGLDPDTHYTYKLLINGEEVGAPMEFTTEKAQDVPNGSFEETSKSASGNYYEFFSPTSAYPDWRTAWWGSGNGSKGVDGSADFGGFVICKPDTSIKADGAQSAQLTSMWALVKFAAGNLFSGYFGGLVGTKGGIVYFGRPFECRPTALKVSLKYSTGKINRISGYPDGEPVTTSDYDRARVFIALGNWNYRTYGGTKECPVKVNTTDTNTFVDFTNDPSTIAFGEIILKGDASNSHDKWVEYTIPLDYNSVTEMPTHIIISCASSMLGDYFTGCDSSKLWVDKMELVYE